MRFLEQEFEVVQIPIEQTNIARFHILDVTMKHKKERALRDI